MSQSKMQVMTRDLSSYSILPLLDGHVATSDWLRGFFILWVMSYLYVPNTCCHVVSWKAAVLVFRAVFRFQADDPS